MSQFGTIERRIVHNRDQDAPRRGKPSCAGAHAEYRREHYIFSRAQSFATQACDWERRLPPLRHWGSNALVNLALKVLGK
ncbi:MAG: hypothetical protein WBQ17_11340 [Rhizomicrobium sp.]|jgi:hypothetical protein